MQDDQFAAAEKILVDIEMVFKKDKKLTDFGIIPVKINQNKSPVIHVDHCMGLESWCVHHVYSYVYRHVMDSRQLRHRREDPAVIGRWLLGALLINPDVSTFWNMRRQLSLADRLDVNIEFLLTAVILSRKPKSAEAFAYRKWLTTRLVSQGESNIATMLAREFELCENAANRQPNNYHAWTHRSWCLMELTPQTSLPLQVCLEQWIWSANWMQTHISDHSGLYYRQVLQQHLYKLIKDLSSHNLLISTPLGAELFDSSIVMLNQYLSLEDVHRKNRKREVKFRDRCNVSTSAILLGIAATELLINVDLILRFSGHEALWYHRRFLLTALKDLSKRDAAGKQGAEGCLRKTAEINASHRNTEGVPVEKDQKLSEVDEGQDEQLCRWLHEVLSWHEYQLIDRCLVKEDYQRRLAVQHQNWLGHVLQLDLSHCTACAVPVEN